MNRRDFCKKLGTATALATIYSSVKPSSAQADDPQYIDVDPKGGYISKPPKQFLFTDLRHIEAGDLQWLSPGGDAFPVNGPPEPPVKVYADLDMIPRGIRLVAQPADKEGPLNPAPPGNIIYDSGLYRSWSLSANYPAGKAAKITINYSESKDGYTWTERKVCELDVAGLTGISADSFFYDPNGSPNERYKAIFAARLLDSNPQAADLWKQYQKIHPRHRDVRINSGVVFCLFGVVSPDGLDWKMLPEPLMVHEGDTDNTVYYDQWLSKYVLYTRLYWLNRRMIARSESDDFRNWTPVEPLIGPSLEDPFTYDVYTNCRTSYPGLPEYHLMFPMFYRRYTQTSEIRLFSSFDGILWNQVPGGPVVTPGGPGRWDPEFICVSKNLVPLGKDRIALCYQAYSHPHKYPRWKSVIQTAGGYVSWPKGRLSAIVADQEGQFYTFELKITGRRLHLNARVCQAGEIRVGIVGVENRQAELCDPIIGDSFAHVVTWKGNPDVPIDTDHNVRLHFKLRAAELFGFEWV